MGLSNRTKLILLGVAVLLLVIAGVWSVQLAESDVLAHLAEELNAFGYTLEGRTFMCWANRAAPPLPRCSRVRI